MARAVESAAKSSAPLPALPYQRMIRDMSRIASVDTSSAAFTGDVLSRIYEATSDDEIWDADDQPPMNAQHLAGCELRLIELAVKYSRGNSEFVTPYVTDDGRQFFLLVTAERISDTGDNKRIMRLPEIGERFTFNTSAAYLTAKLFTFWSRGRFGNGATMDALIQAIDLGGGQAVLKLARSSAQRPVAATVDPEPSF
jgi:hypothetical protein